MDGAVTTVEATIQHLPPKAARMVAVDPSDGPADHESVRRALPAQFSVLICAPFGSARA